MDPAIKKPEPNEHLRYQREKRGWSQQKVAELIDTSEDMVSRWERGISKPSPFYQEKLCALFEKDAEELGLLKKKPIYLPSQESTLVQHPMQYDTQGDIPKKLGTRYIMTDERTKGSSLFEEWDGCFSFGRLKTPLMVLDGDGTEAYLPANIHTHYDSQPAVFFDEVMQAKKQIQQEQEEKQHRGEPFQWNGEKYHLSRIVISREPVRENMTLGLWFKPRDHYTGLATRRCLDDPDFRKKYVPDDWSTPVVGMSCSLGVDITVISSDGYVFLTQRGQHQSVHKNTFHTSISEGISPSLDRSATGREPDLYTCARRGMSEELGLYEPLDFSLPDIQFLSFSVDTHYALYSLHGMVKVNKNVEEILRNWHAGVKDKMENKKLFAVPFTPQEVCSFVFSHEPFSPGGLICLYHALVHEFGKEQVNSALSSY